MNSHRISNPTPEMRREFAPEYAPPKYEIADIFRRYGPAYREKHSLNPMQARAMHAIETCRTTALGAHVDECDHCAHVEISYNSCRNRSCPKCRASQRAQWVEARELELLPLQYFHLVFTLPEALVPLARYNPEALYGLLFRTAADTLRTFADNQWQAKLGIVAVLHTWGQTLNMHPHVHCIVTGGAMKHDGSAFVRAPMNFLFPVKALSPVFRAKYLKGLEHLRAQGKLSFRGQPALGEDAAWQGLRSQLYDNDWVVFAQAPFAEPGHLIRYLGRYVNRIAIANHRLLRIAQGRIAFSYKDNRVKGVEVERVMHLDAETFITRFLDHIPPKGFQRIRYYGLLAGSRRKDNLARARALLDLPNPEQPYIDDIDDYLTRQGIDPTLCPHCGLGHLHNVYQVLSFHDPPPIYAEAA